MPNKWEPLPIVKAVLTREGTDVIMVSAGAGVYRAMEAAGALEKEGISSAVMDLWSVSPLDKT